MKAVPVSILRSWASQIRRRWTGCSGVVRKPFLKLQPYHHCAPYAFSPQSVETAGLCIYLVLSSVSDYTVVSREINASVIKIIACNTWNLFFLILRKGSNYTL